MDDKKINLLPENLRFKEEKYKRPVLQFNPDFKLSGKRKKFKEPKLSGGEPSWWSKIFKSEKKHKPASVAPLQPTFLDDSKNYQEDNHPAKPIAVPMEMRVPAKVEEHIQDFVPTQIKPAKIKGPSLWSRFLALFKCKAKVKINKIDNSALSNGLKYNGNGNTPVQADAKPNIKTFHELNKQAEDIYTFNTKPKQVIPPAPLVKNNIPAFVPAKIKPAKIKGPSWWTRFLAMFKRKAKAKVNKIDSSALSNGLKYNGNGNGNANVMHQPLVKPSVKVFQELNKPAEEAYNLSIKTKKITDMVTEVTRPEPVKAEPIVQKFEQTLVVPAQIKAVKKTKIKGPSLWSRFLAWLKRKSRKKKLANSALSNGLQYNGNNTNQPVSAPAIQVANIPTGNVENFEAKPATSFDLTQKVNEEIGLAPLQSIDLAPEPQNIEIKPLTNDFAMPAVTPKAETQTLPQTEMASLAKPAEVPAPKPMESRFHMPELSQKNSSMTGSVDLIPIAARVRSWKQIITLLFFAIILSTVILGLIYGFVLYQEQKIIAEQNTRKQMISEVEKKIVAFSELNKNIRTLGQEIKLVQDTLNKHIYWTNFFALLEKYTVADVYYSGLAVGTNGGLTLSATTMSYDSVAKQLKVFESAEAGEFVTDASITSARQDKDGAVSFQVILTLNQSLFYYRQTK